MGQDRESAKVLVVDDLEANRCILEEIIRNMGCCPVSARSGEEALRLMGQERPHLILSDISMPGMDGYELCRILKADSNTKSIPVIFISAFDNPKDIVEGLSLGGADYITKPFIPEVVQARVGVHLRLYEAGRELEAMNRRLQVSLNEQLRQLEQEKKDVLYALAGIAAKNSSYKREHIERLNRNCGILAQAMQLSPLFGDKISDTYIDTIELAAPLCDIGNIGIPLELLRKRAPLTEEEMAIVQTHTTIGAKLLGDLHVGNDYNDFLRIAVDIAHYHHENWDGSGYPEGLKREEIPLAAQIVSIIEVYCALTDKKNYGREEAFAIMEGEAGTKFNPDIFRICHRISRQLS
ncbi:MAG: response regulator [Lachnospiraceae bacterium]|uniref:response regulator n=1 Tax=uncultured Acetatifactor sp. TaxID=1671927 RepID=UPI00261DC6F8|nr:HD domain-containing phosphohydrolase [uncultured Acetatifactor sp.]MCI8787592.1 response regulator [Lachnospiraceae bacterium]